MRSHVKNRPDLIKSQAFLCKNPAYKRPLNISKCSDTTTKRKKTQEKQRKVREGNNKV